MNKSKKLLVFLSAIVMLVAVMCFSVNAASATCPNTATGEHTWRKLSGKDATCEESGYSKFRCDYCNEIKTETYPAIGGTHDFQWSYTQECFAQYYCSKCPSKKSVVVDDTKHDWDGCQYDYIAPTCTTDGSYYELCMGCQQGKKTVTLPATGHSWMISDYNVDVGSCSPDYWVVYQCEGCGQDKTVTGATTGHDWEEFCSRRYCGYCDTVEYFTEPKHAWELYGAIDEYTCEEYLHYFCYLCDETKYEKNPNPTDHYVAGTYSYYITVPTCTEEGLECHECGGCGLVSYTEVVPATGHTYLNDWAEILSPSCTGQGVKIKVCNYCSFVNYETLAALGHTDDDTDDVCDVCSVSLKEKTEDKAEDEEEGKTDDSNTNNGNTENSDEENNGSENNNGTDDVTLGFLDRIFSFFERVLEFLETYFGLTR